MIQDDIFIFDPLAADGDEKVAGMVTSPFKALMRSGSKMFGMRQRAGAKAGLSPFMSEMGLRKGALIGAGTGAAMGALSNERDPETGEKKGLLSRMAGGAGKGAVVGGAAGLATRKMYVDPKLQAAKAQAAKTPTARNTGRPSGAERAAIAQKGRENAAQTSTPGGGGAPAGGAPAGGAPAGGANTPPTGAAAAQGQHKTIGHHQVQSYDPTTNQYTVEGGKTFTPAQIREQNLHTSAAALLDPIFTDPLAAALGYSKIAEYEAAPDDDNMGHDLPPAARDDEKAAGLVAFLPVL